MYYLKHKISPAAKIISVILLDALITVLSLIYPLVVKIFPDHLTECAFLRLTGFPCPGCGMMRAVSSLVSFKPIKSFLFHPSVMLFAICLVIFNARVFYSSSKGVKGLENDFQLKLILIPVFSIIVFFVIRLCMILFFGIDLISIANNL